MSVRRLADIPGFNIDRVAAAAGDDPAVLRMENLDTDIPPPAEAVAATRAAVGTDEANSWLPFTGQDDLKESVARLIERRGRPIYDGRREVVITSGEGDAMLDALFCLTDPDDEVILTDPTYAGMINRVRLAGAVPKLAPLVVQDGHWRLDRGGARGSGDRPNEASYSSTTRRFRAGGSRPTKNGIRSLPCAATGTCGCSTGAVSKRSFSMAARCASPPRWRACASARSSSVPPRSTCA